MKSFLSMLVPGLLVYLAMKVFGWDSKKPPITPSQPTIISSSDYPLFTAKELQKAYEENTVAADAQFKGKGYRIHGVVKEISTTAFGQPYVTLSGDSSSYIDPDFFFKENQAALLERLRKGDAINVSCVGAGDIMKAAISKNCVFL